MKSYVLEQARKSSAALNICNTPFSYNLYPILQSFSNDIVGVHNHGVAENVVEHCRVLLCIGIYRRQYVRSKALVLALPHLPPRPEMLVLPDDHPGHKGVLEKSGETNGRGGVSYVDRRGAGGVRGT